MTRDTFADELVHVLQRLAEGDLTARLPRNLKRDNEDAVAFYVGVFAEQLEQRYRSHREYEQAVDGLIEKFIAVAGGDFGVRAERTYRGDPIDTLAYLLNNVAVEVGVLVGAHDHQRMLLETVIESMLDGVLVVDPTGRITRSNGAMARLLGRTAAELRGAPLGIVLAPGEQDLARELGDRLSREALRNRDTVFVAKDGTTLTMAVNASPHLDVHGALVGIVLVTRDDRELRSTRAHLELSDRMATMGMLAAGVAHEINNPLAFISANVDFVLEELDERNATGSLSEERFREIDRALRASRGGAERVRRIVQELRGLTRTSPDIAAPIDLNALVDSALGFADNEVRHHARLVKDYGAPPLVLANEGRLVQAFLNLLHNAAQSIPLGAADTNEIRVATGESGGFAFVEVHDTGSGIPKENLSRIFDLFYTTKPVGEGLGLGLAIALRLIEKAGGRLEVSSRIGSGSVFRVLMPAAPPHATKRRRAKGSHKPDRQRAGTELDILVIDDEPDVGDSVRRILSRDHRVEVSSSAREALQRLAARPYDLVLCDLLMPGMTGMDLHAHLLVNAPEVARRMVFMTGAAFGPEASAFLGAVGRPSVEKPFDARSLRACVAKARVRLSRL